MRTLIDIPDSDLDDIRRRTQEQGISRAEFVRRAIKASLTPPPSKDLSQFFGMLTRGQAPGDLPEDGLTFQDRMRSEWDDR